MTTSIKLSIVSKSWFKNNRYISQFALSQLPMIERDHAGFNPAAALCDLCYLGLRAGDAPRVMIANRRGKVDHPHTQSADADAAASHSSTRRS